MGWMFHLLALRFSEPTLTFGRWQILARVR